MPPILVLTSSQFVTPLLVLKYQNHVHIPPVFLALYAAQTVASMAFWSCPLFRNTWIHRIDAVLARVCITAVTLHKVRVGLSVPFVLAWGNMVGCFVLSNRASDKKWCSPGHLGAHATAHVMAIVATYLAFASSSASAANMALHGL